MRRKDPEEIRRQQQLAKEAEVRKKERDRCMRFALDWCGHGRSHCQEREKEQRKKAAQEEKERREAEREQQRLQKQREKDQQAQQKQVSKEKTKASEKAKQVIRREVLAEQKKMRDDARILVLERFDAEEDATDLAAALAVPVLAAASAGEALPEGRARREVAAELLRGSNSLYADTALTHADAENLLDVATCVQAFQGFLKLQSKVYHLENMLACLRTSELKYPGEAATAEGGLPLYDEYAVKTQAAETDLDRIQLNMLRPVVVELNAALGLREPEKPDESATSRRERKAASEKGSLVYSLPFNQMTWAEVFRMCLVMRIGQEMNKSDEEVR
jgi:hypothetical protein